MIFVTVGNLDPFDRLIKTVDAWLKSRHDQIKVFAQTAHGGYKPCICEWVDFLNPREYRERFEEAKLIISHAGMGTIITAMECNKPIVIMPKRASLGEQRNEHQLATAKRFRRSPRIQVALEETQLIAYLDEFAQSLVADEQAPEPASTEWAPDESLIDFVRAFVSSA